MTLKDKGNNMQDNTGKILRALRKYHGINQIEFAQLLDCNQSTLSRIEMGVLELTAMQWLNLVERYHLDARCITTGKIEQLDPIKFNLKKSPKYGSFKKMPKRYDTLRGSTVRSVYPFLKFISHKLGEEKKNELLTSLKLDPDYFVIQNLPISILAIQDIFLAIEEKGLISIDNYQEILNHNDISDTHSFFLESLKVSSAGEVAFKKLTKFVASHFEINSNYEFIGDKKCFVKATNQSFLKELKLDDTFEKFRSLYNLSHFDKLAPLLKWDGSFKLNNLNDGWEIACAT